MKNSKARFWRRQDANEFKSFTPKAVNWYIDIRENEYGWTKPENTVNADEGGVMSGFDLDSLVVGSSDPKHKALLKEPQSRSWATFIEAITADGRVLTPSIVFKSKDLQSQWFIGVVALKGLFTTDAACPSFIRAYALAREMCMTQKDIMSS